MAACGLAVWIYVRWASRKARTAKDVTVPQEPVPTDAGAKGEAMDPREVREALRRNLLAGDLAVQDDGEQGYSLPFLETEPLHHEVDGDAKGPGDPFEDTVPGFSWSRADQDPSR